MAEIAEVKQAPSQKGKPKPHSEIASPYYNLDKAIELAQTMFAEAGGTCDRAQLAGLLKYSGVKNGGFLSRVSSAKMFGVIEENAERLTLTERAKQILSPVLPTDAERAKVEAFLSVELFKKIYEQFKGQTLPTDVGLKNLLRTQYGIIEDRIVPTLRVMMDSAESSGLFKLAGNRSRMTLPILPSTEATPAPLPDIPKSIQKSQDSYSGGGGNGNGGGGIDPAFVGLLKNLPPAGSKLGPKRRKALTDAFTSTVNFLYPEEDEEA